MQVGVVVPDVSDSEGITKENEELVELQRQDNELGLVVTFLNKEYYHLSRILPDD